MKRSKASLGQHIYTQGGFVHSAGEFASQEGRAVGGWVNDATPGAALAVLTSAGLVVNLVPGDVYYLTQIMFAVESVSDDCHFEVGFTDNPNGGGIFYPVTPHWHMVTGAAITGGTTQSHQFIPPVRIAYADGARSITFRTQANDAGATVTCGFWGYKDRE